MFGFLGRILGGDRALDSADNMIDKVASGLDKLHFSEQEKTEYSIKAGDQYLEYMKTQTDQNSVRSRTRRVLAVALVLNFLGLLNASAVAYCLNKLELAKHLLTTAGTLSSLVLLVCTFYFGYYAISNVVKKIKGK